MRGPFVGAGKGTGAEGADAEVDAVPVDAAVGVRDEPSDAGSVTSAVSTPRNGCGIRGFLSALT